ncbi:GNAT family N-acetyltransferase [Flavobacterium sp. AC]|uniref:GNAT family N-acetyltransferase n=1 Tax=Flavobacterium azizsancarii TaxID=2961580 RepID=A0ABT4WCS5_9FLAO|nr:GNAT family N-acetyltransferase [Flavobacterium azizsancarii]MDA6070384.1 GNAT family N-acetyltransferase [Flavobacterium azizsancarii]
MTTLQTLENTPIEKLLEVFNLSFSDYIVPFYLTKEQLEDKIKSDSIKLEFSVGAFQDNQLIAFILHGYELVDQLKIVYNAGTGVIPAKRGNKLTAKLYEYVLPILHQNNIDKLLLEVITKNECAIKTYKNIGFKIIRELNCYKGVINITNRKSDFEIRKLEEYNWQKLQSFWDIKPSWQNSITSLEKLKNFNISLGIYDNEKLLGYTVFNPKLKRIHQLSVDKNYRGKGAGRQLLQYIATNYEKDVSATNIENASKETLSFMKDIGMNIFVKQYEMEFLLK